MTRRAPPIVDNPALGSAHLVDSSLPRGSLATTLLAAVARAVRSRALARLRAAWNAGPLDLILPSGDRARIGPAGPAEAVVHIHDERALLRILLRGELGGGEAFVAGEWSSPDLVAVLRLILRATVGHDDHARPPSSLETPLTRLAQLPALVRHRRAANTPGGSERNIHAHYDLGNDFYRRFLDDETMAYSSAIFAQPGMTLAEAQREKQERLCRMLELTPRDHLLEIGCGWGGMAIHAARTRGCRVTAITISRAQYELARARVADAGVADRVDIQYRDYRTLDGRYDKAVSIEMLEAVGFDYLPQYFAVVAGVLPPGGRFALQSITMPEARFESYRRRVDWMQTYIFPGSLIPSLTAIAGAAGAAGFRIDASDDIGPHYATTLRAWRERFEASRDTLSDVGRLPQAPSAPREDASGRRRPLDETFFRTWSLYLAFSEAAFAERTLADHQLLLTAR